jgi:hypothetical protein
VRFIVSVLARRFRSRVVLELEVLALRHQLHVFRRQRPVGPGCLRSIACSGSGSPIVAALSGSDGVGLPRLPAGRWRRVYPVLGVPQRAVKITGEVKYYESIPDSGKPTRRGFCPNCGSRLFGRPSVLPDLIMIMAGSLDDPSAYRPGMDIYTASAQPWDHMNPAVPKFPKMPPMG